MIKINLFRLVPALMLCSFQAEVFATDGTWSVDAAGNWSDPSKWTGALVADGTDATATLGDVITANRTITLDSNRANGNIRALDTTHDYTIGGTSTLTLDVTTGSPAITNLSGRTLTISCPIAGSDGLAMHGVGTLTLSGDNAFTGNILVSAGTLKAELASNTLSPTSGALGNVQTVGRTLTISPGATLDFTKADVMGNENTLPKLTIIVNGGTIRNTTSSANSGFNMLGPLQLNGGTLSSFGGGYGFSIWVYPAFALGGTVTVGGSAVSTISTTGNYNSGDTTSPAGIGLQTAAKGSTTFDVADAVSGSDLNVTGMLQNWGTDFSNNPGALIKTGIGTMTLSGTNTYTGSTTVNAGTLSLAGGKALADGTSLYTTNSAKIHLAANETINKLYLDGREARAGTWGSSASAATYKWDNYFTGTAVLNVSSGTGIIPPVMGTLFLVH